MNIQINENYRIVSDEQNVIVQRRHVTDPTKAPNWAERQAKGETPTPREEWRNFKWCATIEQAMQRVFEQGVRDSEATTLAELLAEIRGFRGEIKALLGFER
jgi:hypothetical protein